jgi:hypothetical protein
MAASGSSLQLRKPAHRLSLGRLQLQRREEAATRYDAHDRGCLWDTNGIAPGLEFSLTYKRLEFSSTSEYVFDTSHKAGNFFYSWPQLTYSLLDWLKVGVVAQHTKAYHTGLGTQRGLLVGVSYKKWKFTTYVFDPELSQPTTVLELGVSF